MQFLVNHTVESLVRVFAMIRASVAEETFELIDLLTKVSMESNSRMLGVLLYLLVVLIGVGYKFLVEILFRNVWFKLL